MPYVDKLNLIDAINSAPASMSVCMNTDECHGMMRMKEMMIHLVSSFPEAKVEPMSDLTTKGFSNGQYVDRFLLRDKLYKEDAITIGGMAILNNFPAADVVPVRHGRWIVKIIRGDKRTVCSECLLETGTCYEENYCPNCGAKMMDGDGDV